MKHRPSASLRRSCPTPPLLAVALVGMVVIGASPASAQLKKAPSPEGAWAFQTEKMAFGCALSGDMIVTPATDKAFTCSFRAIWACERRPPKAVHTEQSCIATQSGGEIVITSRIEKIVEVDPADMGALMQQRYAADHFTVTINARGDEMDGMFQSYGAAPVKFRRKLDLLS